MYIYIYEYALHLQTTSETVFGVFLGVCLHLLIWGIWSTFGKCEDIISETPARFIAYNH